MASNAAVDSERRESGRGFLGGAPLITNNTRASRGRAAWLRGCGSQLGEVVAAGRRGFVAVLRRRADKGLVGSWRDQLHVRNARRTIVRW